MVLRVRGGLLTRWARYNAARRPGVRAPEPAIDAVDIARRVGAKAKRSTPDNAGKLRWTRHPARSLGRRACWRVMARACRTGDPALAWYVEVDAATLPVK